MLSPWQLHTSPNSEALCSLLPPAQGLPPLQPRWGGRGVVGGGWDVAFGGVSGACGCSIPWPRWKIWWP